MKIGTLSIKEGAALAPMAGVADTAFRLICKQLGAVYLVGEMVSAKGLIMSESRSAPLLVLTEEERPAAVQLFGAVPEELERAAAVAMKYAPDVIDINMGCPVPKVVGGGAGSAIMRTPRLAGELVRAVRRGCGDSVPVTAKIRKGFSDDNAVEVAKILEDAGAAMVAVHGRTREQYYQPGADWDVIARVKAALSIPVAGNGDVTDADSYFAMRRETGCDLVMIGRGALGNPFVFEEIAARLAGGSAPAVPLCRRMHVMLRHMALLVRCKGETVGMREARKHAAWYLKGMRGAAELRRQAAQLTTLEDAKRLAELALQNEKFV